VKNITFLGNNEFSLGKKLKFLKEKCFFSSANMIVPQKKKALSYSSGQLKLLLLRNMIVPQGKANFSKEQ